MRLGDLSSGVHRLPRRRMGLAAARRAALFERMSLERSSPGLSWLIILRKRPGFRAAFADFDPSDRRRLRRPDVSAARDQGIVRNRAKINATINNAQRIADAVPEGWTRCCGPSPRPGIGDPVAWGDVPATSPESTAMARELRSEDEVRRAHHPPTPRMAGHRHGRRPHSSSGELDRSVSRERGAFAWRRMRLRRRSDRGRAGPFLQLGLLGQRLVEVDVAARRSTP